VFLARNLMIAGALAVMAITWLPVTIPPATLSLAGMLALAAEVLIGLSLGFVLQLSFAAPVLAAEQIGGAMGLSIASSVDPVSGAQSPALGQYFTVLLTLEDLGFCKKGEGGAFVASGAIAPGGALPVNTNGGGLSCVHPGMYGMFTLLEAVQQLRGEAGARQVAGAELALCHGNGGVLSSQVSNILGTEATL